MGGWMRSCWGWSIGGGAGVGGDWSVEMVSLNFFLSFTGLTFPSQSIAAGTSSLPRAISGPCLPPPGMGGSRSVITRAGWLFMGFVICSNFRCNFFNVSILRPV